MSFDTGNMADFHMVPALKSRSTSIYLHLEWYKNEELYKGILASDDSESRAS
jgi:hypothetical protein